MTFLLVLSGCATSQAYKPGTYLLHYYGSNGELLHQMAVPSRPLARNELESGLDNATMDSRNKRRDEIYRIRNNLCKAMTGARVTITSPAGVVISDEKCPSPN